MDYDLRVMPTNVVELALGKKQGGMSVDLVLLIVTIAIYSGILTIIYRQSFNIVFMFAKQPWLWMLLVSMLGVANVAIAYLLGWNPRTVATATLLAAFLQLAPGTPKGVEKSEIKNAVDETYIEMGISHGRAKARLGLFMFFAVSVASYILAFSEVCSKSGQCTPLLYRLVGG